MAAPPALANVLRPHGEFAIIGPGGGVDVSARGGKRQSERDRDRDQSHDREHHHARPLRATTRSIFTSGRKCTFRSPMAFVPALESATI